MKPVGDDHGIKIFKGSYAHFCTEEVDTNKDQDGKNEDQDRRPDQRKIGPSFDL